MSRKSGVSPKQINRIRELNAKGYSSNRIQKQLRSEHIGLRRQIILNYTREFRGRPAQKNVSKYIPHKYRKNRTYRPNYKVITISGSVKGKNKKLNIVSSNGKSLHKILREHIFNFGKTKQGYSPKSQFLTVDADKLLANPKKYLDEKEFDKRPIINS
jgi:hypothetical protein